VNAGMAAGFAAVVNAVATAASTTLLARIGFLQVSQALQALLTGFAPPLSQSHVPLILGSSGTRRFEGSATGGAFFSSLYSK
jgi:hypothetical protein